MAESYTEATVAWLMTWGFCWRCHKRGAWGHGLQPHHFVRGVNRQANDLKTIGIACEECHDAEHRGDGLGILGCLALKRHYDPALFDLPHVCRVAGKAEACWTTADVMNAANALMVRGILP
jgi:hypothetical protein